MGCWWEDAATLLDQILQAKDVDLQGVLTHFPAPDDKDFTNQQRERFLSVIQPALAANPNLLVHADNSSSLQTMHPDSPFNGFVSLLQFGIAPPRDSVLANIAVEPVLSFHSRLALVKIYLGASLSYGCEKVLSRDSRIRVVAGNGDAIPLHCGGQARGLINGKFYPLVGRVTMDQTLIDLTDAETEPTTGEIITLIGKQREKEIGLGELSRHGNTIEWELLCSITKRVPRIYLTKRVTGHNSWLSI